MRLQHLRLRDLRRDAELDARQGDKTLLICLARKGGLDRRLQRLVADILDGTLKRKPGRPRTVEKEIRAERIREFAWAALPGNMAFKARVHDTVEGLKAQGVKVSKRTVYSALEQPVDYVSLADIGARYLAMLHVSKRLLRLIRRQ
jgi:hypothetical protein